MTLSNFFLICLILGFALSVISLLAGSHHLHLPHMQHGIHIHGTNLPWFNIGTLAAFLTWFGGTGYLLKHVYGIWFLAAFVFATAGGVGAAAVVFLFMTRVLMAHEAALDPADFDMIGVLGRVSMTIRAGGTGEVIYSQQGTRRVTGARAEDGAPVPKGTEVIVTRYEKGIAWIRPWEDLIAEGDPKDRQEKTL